MFLCYNLSMYNVSVIINDSSSLIVPNQVDDLVERLLQITINGIYFNLTQIDEIYNTIDMAFSGLAFGAWRLT